MAKRVRDIAVALGVVLLGLGGGAAKAGGIFSVAIELCTNCHSYDVAVDASGKVYAVWSTGPYGTGGLELWTSADGGKTFTQVGTPHSAITGVMGSMAVASKGDIIHLVWMDFDLAGPQLCDADASAVGLQPGACFDVFYARSLDGGKIFSAPHNISNADYGLFRPRIAIDATGAVVNVVWNQATTGETNICCAREIYFSRSTDGGQTFSLP